MTNQSPEPPFSLRSERSKRIKKKKKKTERKKEKKEREISRRANILSGRIAFLWPGVERNTPRPSAAPRYISKFLIVYPEICYPLCSPLCFTIFSPPITTLVCFLCLTLSHLVRCTNAIHDLPYNPTARPQKNPRPCALKNTISVH